MKTIYFLTAGVVEIEGTVHNTFGIACRSDAVSLTADDISCDEARLRGWVDCMNRYELEPIHFYDIIDDILADI